MTRVLSGAALVLIAVAIVWFSTPLLFFLAGEGLLVLAFVEYVALARAHKLDVPEWPAGAAGESDLAGDARKAEVGSRP